MTKRKAKDDKSKESLRIGDMFSFDNIEKFCFVFLGSSKDDNDCYILLLDPESRFHFGTRIDHTVAIVNKRFMIIDEIISRME